MNYQKQLTSMLNSSQTHMRCLEEVRNLQLIDCWIAAGFIRNHVWNHLSDSNRDPTYGSDIDVIYYSHHKKSKKFDITIEKTLKEKLPHVGKWSVKN